MKKEDKAKFKLALTKAVIKLQEIVTEHLPEEGVAQPVSLTMPIVGTKNEAVFVFDNAAVPYIGKRTFIIGARRKGSDKTFVYNALTGKDRSDILEYLRREGLVDQLTELLAKLSDMADNN